MKKFLEFIWELIGPLIIFILTGIICMLGLLWVCTLFGLIIIFAPIDFPSPLWLRWVIGIFDSLVLIILVYEQIRDAYEKVYKN
jgi:hypothetical protein